ncbi:ankyrin [Trichoderma longibrachiatum ATCC 18648]|uniref:Ankyrin n=1 Tax=Trichoderma longibrachiatum ATCC 18648 TaxID=983965 RepID=A0A2T4C9Q2_TRILO|nr:ankyrin [Trichoderma longibrachiatum ATCC 18648]
MLVKGGADVNSHNGRESPLSLAVARGHIRMVDVLLDHGADLEARDEDGKTPLFRAMRRPDSDMFHHLIRRGARIDVKDRNGASLLHEAAGNGVVSYIDHLIESGLNVNRTDEFGRTPLHAAVLNDAKASFLALLMHGADPDVRNADGYSALERARSEGNDADLLFAIEQSWDS